MKNNKWCKIIVSFNNEKIIKIGNIYYISSLLSMPQILLSGVRKTHYDHSNDPWFKQRFSSSEAEQSSVIKPKPVPPYLKRARFVPRKVEEFGDGGAFPEIHVAQYPLGMGRDKSNKPG